MKCKEFTGLNEVKKEIFKLFKPRLYKMTVCQYLSLHVCPFVLMTGKFIVYFVQYIFCIIIFRVLQIVNLLKCRRINLKTKY